MSFENFVDCNLQYLLLITRYRMFVIAFSRLLLLPSTRFLWLPFSRPLCLPGTRPRKSWDWGSQRITATFLESKAHLGNSILIENIKLDLKPDDWFSSMFPLVWNADSIFTYLSIGESWSDNGMSEVQPFDISVFFFGFFVGQYQCGSRRCFSRRKSLPHSLTSFPSFPNRHNPTLHPKSLLKITDFSKSVRIWLKFQILTDFFQNLWEFGLNSTYV